jgi:hypothetical protein
VDHVRELLGDDADASPHFDAITRVPAYDGRVVLGLETLRKLLEGYTQGRGKSG